MVFGNTTKVENAKLYQRAKSLEQAGLTKKALELYDELLLKDAGNSQYYQAYKRFLKNLGDNKKLLEIATTYYQNNQANNAAKFEWISGLIINQKKIWKNETELFIEENFLDKNLMRQILYEIYSANLTNELKPITNLIRSLTGNSSFLARELGDIFMMRMDYKSSISEYILYIKKNPEHLSKISDKIMTIPNDIYITNQVREILKNNKNNFTKIILSNLEFREKNYQSAWNILKMHTTNDELLINMGKELINHEEFDFAEKIFQEILKNSKTKKITEKCIYHIGRILESKSIFNTNQLPISGFFKDNPFFTTPFISINHDVNYLTNAINIFDSLSTNLNSNDAKFRLAEIKFRALNDLDGANKIYLELLKSSSKYDLIKNCIFRLIDIEIAKGNLNLAKNKIRQYNKMITKKNDQNQLKIKSAQILMFEGKKDSLSHYINNTLNFIKSTDISYNEILEILGLLLTFQNNTNLFNNFGKAQFLIHQNKRQEALYILETLDTIDSPLLSELIQYQIICLYLMQKDYISAIELATILNGETIYSELANILQCEIVDFIHNDYILAVDLYLEFLEKFPDSIYYDNIRLRLRKLAG